MSIVPTSAVRLLILCTPDARAAMGHDAARRSLYSEKAGASAGPAWEVLAASAAGPAAHPWDLAHHFLDTQEATLAAADLPYAEPDLLQQFLYRPDERAGLSGSGENVCDLHDPDGFWPPVDLGFAWHLDDDYSGLGSARRRVGAPAGPRVRVALLDTGFDPAHASLPRHLRPDLGRNFVDGDRPDDATDPGSFLPQVTNPGHGTATLALLAGGRVRPAFAPQFDDDLGGCPEAEVIPVRIANSVVHFRTSEMAAGLEYATEMGCAVVSLSMGGVPSQAWADAVNRAYEAGVVICAAAGNNISGYPVTSIVYPARFGRVIAACGITADFAPYYQSGRHGRMQGNFGLDGKMGSAIAAFTPNTPWATMGCSALIDRNGGGTSSAAPQVAAAAALYLQHHRPALGQWQTVEAVRNALFDSATRT